MKRKNFLGSLSIDTRSCIPAIICIVALLLIGQIMSPGFASAKNISSVLAQAMLLLIISIGQALVFIVGKGGIDLSIGAFVSMGALIGAEFMNGQNALIPIGIIVVVLFGAGFGLVNGLGVQYLKIPALAMTLALSSVIDGFTIWFTNGLPQAKVPSMLMQMGRQWIWQVRPIIVIGVIILVLVEIFMRNTKLGRSFYLVGSSREAARLGGLPVNRLVVLAYILSGVFASVGGLLFFGYVGAGQIRMGDSYTMMSIAAVVIGGVSVNGGRGTFIGVALGSIVYLLISSVLIALGLAVGVRTFFQGVILAVILIVNCRSEKLRK